MSKWTDLAKIAWSKLWTPANKAKALDVAAKEVQKIADREKGKCGDISIAIAVCIAVSFVFGIVFGKGGVKTRCAIQQTEINIKGSSNVVYVVNGTNIVDVSGSGGVSIPVSAAK